MSQYWYIDIKYWYLTTLLMTNMQLGASCRGTSEKDQGRRSGTWRGPGRFSNRFTLPSRIVTSSAVVRARANGKGRNCATHATKNRERRRNEAGTDAVIVKPNRSAVSSMRNGGRGENSRRLVDVQLMVLAPDRASISRTPVRRLAFATKTKKKKKTIWCRQQSIRTVPEARNGCDLLCSVAGRQTFR